MCLFCEVTLDFKPNKPISGHLTPDSAKCNCTVTCQKYVDLRKKNVENSIHPFPSRLAQKSIFVSLKYHLYLVIKGSKTVNALISTTMGMLYLVQQLRTWFQFNFRTPFILT